MDSEDEALAVCAGALGIIIIEECETKKKRFWARKFLLQRHAHSLYNTVLKELYVEDRQGFRNFIRMTAGQFETLLQLVAPHITKMNTNFQPAISPEEQLVVTLRFLATGNSYTSLMYSHKISLSKISETVPRVCSVIIEVLKDYIKEPSTEEEWERIAEEYERIWNFPHCIGAIDGRHIEIIQPAGSGSLYFNYTKSFSIVLLALVDANYNVISFEVGIPGSISDGGVLSRSSLGRRLEKGEMALPKARPLPGRTVDMPFVIVGDDAFALSKYLMKPYPGWHEKGSKERIYNYRTSRARRICENFFGILTAVFRCLRTTLNIKPERVALVTAAAVHLHNFLRKEEKSAMIYSPPSSFDVEDVHSGAVNGGSWRNIPQNKPLQKRGGRRARDAVDLRDEFANYFVTDIGKVEWQEKYA